MLPGGHIVPPERTIVIIAASFSLRMHIPLPFTHDGQAQTHGGQTQTCHSRCQLFILNAHPASSKGCHLALQSVNCGYRAAFSLL